MGRPVARKIDMKRKQDKKTETKLGGIDHTARSDEGTLRAAEIISYPVFKTNEKTREFQQDEQHMVLRERDNLQLLEELEERNRRLPFEIFALGKENYVSLKTVSSSRG